MGFCPFGAICWRSALPGEVEYPPAPDGEGCARSTLLPPFSTCWGSRFPTTFQVGAFCPNQPSQATEVRRNPSNPFPCAVLCSMWAEKVSEIEHLGAEGAYTETPEAALSIT